MTDSVYFGDMMRTLHEILDELKSMNKKLDSLKEKFNTLNKFQKANFREIVKDNTLQYTKKNGKIDFPWEILLLTARS